MSKKQLPPTASHGTDNGYSNHSCRCEPCKAAHSRVMRDCKRKRLNARVLRDGRWYHPTADHGTYNAYANYGCRCLDCLGAHRAYTRSYRKDKANA